MFYVGVFRLQFQKTLVVFEISTLKFVKNDFLINTMNFGIGFAFSNGLRSPFSEGPGPGQRQLYKACPINV